MLVVTDMNISVLMSVYNGERPEYLLETLKSLDRQTYRADEVVLVEDGPINPDLLAVVDRFRNALNIHSVVLSRNCGLGAALNAGLEACSHSLVARMDTDDIALPERFALQIAAFDADAALDVVGGYAIEIDQSGRRGKIRSVPTDSKLIRQTMWANPMLHPTIMYRRDAIRKLGGYSAGALRCEDYELWFRCAKAGYKFGNISKPLIEYRFTPETHKRQSRGNMWRQGIIGFTGSSAIGLPLWKQLACFAPFVRSLLPISMQHHAYRVMQKIDPRRAQ